MRFAAAEAVVVSMHMEEGTNRIGPHDWLASEKYFIG